MYVVSFVFLCMVHVVCSVEDHELCKHTTCHECITDPMKCVWCSADVLDLDQRCKPAGSYISDWCPVGAIEEANNEINIIDDRNFTSEEEKAVQIKPQKIKIKLRVGETAKFKFQYKAAKDYPVDLYFLFDASISMNTIRNETITKSEEIYNALKGLTNKVYLGLGSFIDKKLIPYNRVNRNQEICYSFKHWLNLTGNVEIFKEELQNVELGTNYDWPESGFDGLAQIMACKETIVWRKQSRKLIILITDAFSHSAGDGKHSGIYKPYDGGCYLDSNGLYYNEKQMDYPSVGIISKLAADRQFTIIFATKYDKKLSPKVNPYTIISDAIQGARSSTYDTETISNTLKEIYQKISQNINLDVNIAVEDQKYFEINFNPDCRENNNINCTVAMDEEKTIDGTIKLLEYYEKNHLSVTVVQQGLEEHLLLDIDIISSCKCQGEKETEYNSTDCSESGDSQCGICSCNQGRSGPICQCSESNDKASNTTCIKDDVLCSQNGDCNCGVCSCRPGFDGHYCEFRSDSCKRDSYGALCSGHGKCRNGRCQCSSSWEGEVCSCINSKLPCRDTQGIECNNRGHCYCGRCKCNKLPKWDVRDYTDEYCSQEAGEDYHKRQCRALVSCYSCHGSADCSEECCEGITAVNVAEDMNGNWSVCTNVRVSFGCYSNFGYIYNDEAREIILYIYSEPTCMESYYIYAGVSLGALVLVGMSSLVAWRLGIAARDNAEFKQFLKCAREDNEELLNECYKSPTQSVQNPMFGKLSFRNRSFR